MKRFNLLMVVVFLLMTGLSNAEAKSKEEANFAKCCKKVKKEVRKALEGPSFEYLLPDAQEAVTIKCIVNEDNQLILHKIYGNDERLIEHIKKSLKEKVITVDERFSKKMLQFDLVFYHRKNA